MKTIALLTTDIRDLEAWEMVLSLQDSIKHIVIDLLDPLWMEMCLNFDYDLYIVRSPGTTHLMKQIFDERIQILAEELKKPIYPSLAELRLHENKKYLAIWLKANSIPHPDTSVIIKKKHAMDFLDQARYPVVFKQNIGSSGKGVKIIKNIHEGRALVDKVFRKGVRPNIGPNLRTASLYRKIKNAVTQKGLMNKRLTHYRAVYSDPQKYLIFQEYIQHSYEWRVVVIDDSFFAHKKIVTGTMASGSLTKNYDTPPESILDFTRMISMQFGLHSTSMDFFETKDGFLVNEIQTYFGQSDPFQMKVEGVVGRYRFIEEKWIFEPGDWAANQCYDLRLSHVMNLLGVENA